MIEVSVCGTCRQFGRMLNNFGECGDCTKERELEQIRTDLLAWAGLHRGKAISEEAMPRFHEIMDELLKKRARVMTDWLRNVPVYDNLAQVANAINKAMKTDKDEFERCDSDYALAGLACYLAEHYVPTGLKENILQIVDVYCGKPVEPSEGKNES